MARMTPMKEDQNDKRYLRDTTQNLCTAAYGASVPFFFNKYGGAIDLVGQYHGGTCFIVSNGPSLNNINLDLLKTPGVMIMSLNNGPSTLLNRGIVPNFWTCVDQPSRFIKQIWLNPAIQKFIPTASFDKDLWDNEEWKPLNDSMGIATPAQCPNVIGFRRNEKFAGHRFFTETSFNWGCHKDHGGCRTVLLPAIRIPYMLGFRRVFLLGVDLHMSDSAKYHFNEGRTVSAIRNNEHTYKRIIEEYGPNIRAAADKLGYKIYNCNPDSALKAFEHMPFTDAVTEATGVCWPRPEADTRGMYVEWSEKVGTTRDQAMQKTGLVPPAPKA